MIPHNLIWSNTAAAEPSAAFFSGLTVLFFLTWLRSQKIVHLFLLAVTLPLACQMRPESGLIVIWSMAAILILSPGTIMKRRVWAMGLLTALFLLPHLLHLYAMSGQSWGAEGVKFSAGYFLNNLRVNGPYYINNSQFPVFVTLLALAGCLRGKGTHTRSMLISIWFLLFWGIFLFFYAGSYRYGTDVRFALVTFMPLAILAGLGGGKLSEIVSHSARLDIPERYAAALIILVLLFSWISFLPMIRTVGQEAWAARFDHLYARD
ncbi:MAG: hypothetical protein NTY64_16910, partial [Deltaproteobacteria bacterium]|nr:hypothetical protein [Deltaproteobacteria bacterium]